MGVVEQINNPFDLLLALMLWAFWLLALFGAFAVIVGITIGIVRGFANVLRRPKRPSTVRVRQRAEIEAIMRYKDEPNADWRVDCFMAGAEFALQQKDHGKP